ncbi:MAG: hypothetical protein ACRECO_18945 [Xanthobacteraceae bacterium]
MRVQLRPFCVFTALMVAGLLAGPLAAQQSDQLPKPKPYKPVTVKPPQPATDPSFAAFRKQLVGIAKRKDRAGLTKVIAANFFWIPADKDVADKSKPWIETLAKAIGLDGPEGIGWQILGSYASDPTADRDPSRKDMLCSPGDPNFDLKAADAVAQTTGTDPQEWAYPVSDGIEVRAEPAPGSRVVGKLGMHLVWVYPDQSPASAVHAESVRIVMPSGAVGFVPIDALLALEGDQLCYAKEGDAWKIAGLRGGDPEAAK